MMANPDFGVLVVDDSSMIRNILRRELESGGYRVAEAVHGFDALAKAADFHPDLVTLDVEMPKLNGFETCRKLREPHYARFFGESPDAMGPVIFVTSLDTIEDRKKGFQLGAMDFITKPFEPGAILQAVNTILRPENRLRGLTALVADVNEASRRVVSDCLRREGVETVETADGGEAWAIVRSRPADIDIVIAGLPLPTLNGGAMCRKIRTELGLSELPVIFLPVVDDKDELFELFKAGATDYLLQPFVKEEFLARLVVHLERAGLNKRLRNALKEVEGFNQALESTITRLTNIGASLTSEKNLNKLLEMVVSEAREATGADGGALYILKNGQLQYTIVQNRFLNSQLGGEGGDPVALAPISLDENRAPAHCANHKEILHILDIYECETFDFSHLKQIDQDFECKNRSMLVLPMLDRNQAVVGVLQLVNSIDPATHEIRGFPKKSIDIAYSLSCQAAVCIENALSYEKIEKKNTAFKRFVPNEFLRFLNKIEIEDIGLGDTSETELSVLFTDIRSFTNLSEQMTPEENFKFLNNYLRFIGPVIDRNDGFIDKYIGDAIMALFGGHRNAGAQEAVNAAVNMQETIKQYNRYRHSSGYDPITIGIGINTGRMILGTIGFESRMDSTVIGDSVNLASRLEGLTKKYAIPIAISSFTKNALADPGAFLIREIDVVRVKGKEQATTVYEVFDNDEESIRDVKRRAMGRYDEGIAQFRRGEWKAAHERFAELREILPGDRVVEIYEQRSREFMERPPESLDLAIMRMEEK